MEVYKVEIKILGSGCRKCCKLEDNAKKAAEKLGIDAKVTKVKDFKDIMSYNVMQTPAMVVNEQVLVKGRVAKVDEIVEILKQQ